MVFNNISMVGIRVKTGDIFAVKINSEVKKYFQYLCSDLAQLNSDVIRVFDSEYRIDATPDLLEVIDDKIQFYAHVFLRLGYKMGYWEKVGNVKETGKTDHILFRSSDDYGHKLGDEPIKVSANWYVWNINDEQYKKVGKLIGENRKAEIGIVVNPQDIVTRMRAGKYDFFFPDYQ